MLSRDVAQAEIDPRTLAALGLTRRQMVAGDESACCSSSPAAPIVALVFAVAASPLFPIGIARHADHAGLSLRWARLGARAGRHRRVRRVRRPPVRDPVTRSTSATTAPRAWSARRSMAELIARSSLRPPIAQGVRMATEPGHGASAVPVRSAMFGAAFGVVGLTALHGLHVEPRSALIDSTSLRMDLGLQSPRPHVHVEVRHGGLRPECCFRRGRRHSSFYETGLLDGRPTTGWGFMPFTVRSIPRSWPGPYREDRPRSRSARGDYAGAREEDRRHGPRERCEEGARVPHRRPGRTAAAGCRRDSALG